MKEKTHLIRTHNKGQTEFITHLQNCNIDFIVKTTSSSTSIEYTDKYGKCKRIFCDGLFLGIKEMILQKKLKKHIKNRNAGRDFIRTAVRQGRYLEINKDEEE